MGLMTDRNEYWHTVLALTPTTRQGSENELDNDKERTSTIFPSSAASRSSANNTGDKRCLDKIATWLYDCSQHHEACKAPAYSTGSNDPNVVYPRRLIDVSGKGIRLVASNEIAVDCGLSYMTVSHK
jgi:hypothetical protein